MQISTLDHRWLAQLLCVNAGAHFELRSLPIYKYYANDPQKIEQLRQDFEA